MISIFSNKNRYIVECLQVLILLFCASLIILGYSKVSLGVVSLLGASIIWAIIARCILLKLYIPGRYITYGIGTVSVFWIALVIGRIGKGKKNIKISTAWSNIIALIFCLIIWGLLGALNKPSRGLWRNGNRDIEIYDFLKTLPPEILIAGHPIDCNDFPYWAGRGVLLNTETSFPARVKMWNRQKIIGFDLLMALYATDRKQVTSFINKYNVTHFVLRQVRYNAFFKKNMRSVEPFTSLAQHIVKKINNPKDFALMHINKDSVVYLDKAWIVIDVKSLLDYWDSPSSSISQ